MNNSTINLLYFMYIALCENVLVHEMLESARYRVDKAANSIALLVPRFPLHSLFHHQWWNLAGSLLKKPLFEKIGCNSNIKVTEVVIVFCDHSRNLAQINSKFWRICIKKCLRGPYILRFMYMYNNCVQYRKHFASGLYMCGNFAECQKRIFYISTDLTSQVSCMAEHFTSINKKIAGSIPTVVWQTFQLARCGCTLRVTSQTSYSPEYITPTQKIFYTLLILSLRTK